MWDEGVLAKQVLSWLKLLAEALRHFSQGSPSFPTLSVICCCRLRMSINHPLKHFEIFERHNRLYSPANCSRTSISGGMLMAALDKRRTLGIPRIWNAARVGESGRSPAAIQFRWTAPLNDLAWVRVRIDTRVGPVQRVM